MTAATVQPASRSGAAPRHAWNYVSGRVAALETELLPDAAYEGILRCTRPGEARTALSKTRYRGLFPSDESVEGYSDVLDSAAQNVAADALKDCPPHAMASFFQLPRRYKSFRTLFLQRSSRGAGPEELEQCFGVLADPPADEALAPHRDQLHVRDAPQAADAVARSLFLDSAACAAALALARLAPEPEVAQFLHDAAALRTWAALLRSRWNRAPADVIRRWFLLDDALAEFVALAAVEGPDPSAPVLPLVSPGAAAALEALGAERLRRNVDAAVDAALRPGVLACRMVPFGPERALSYLVALEVEMWNLQICLAAVVHGIDAEAARERLRPAYA